MIYKYFPFIVDQMEIVGNEIVQSVRYWQFIKKAESCLIKLRKHVEFIFRDMVQVEAVASFKNFCLGTSTKKEWVFGDIKKTLLEIVDDIYTLISGTSKSVSRPYDQLCLTIVQSLIVRQGILFYEKTTLIKFHNAFCCVFCKDMRFSLFEQFYAQILLSPNLFTLQMQS